MDREPSRQIPSMEGPVGYPRKNGEPVFDAPWQSRAFGMVVNLHTRGLYPWDEFKTRLIGEIAAGAESTASGPSPGYYEHWVRAFMRLLADRQLVSEEELARRVDEFKSGARREVY